MPYRKQVTFLATLVSACLAVASSSGCDGGSGASACGCGNRTGLMVHMELSCFCGQDGARCPASLTEYLPQLDCTAGPPVVRRSGCGRITFSAGYSEVTFDAATDALVGDAEFGDTLWGKCAVIAYVYGRELFPSGPGVTADDACDAIEQCTYCGTPTADAPPC